MRFKQGNEINLRLLQTLPSQISADVAVEKQRLDFICRNCLTAICSIWMIFSCA